MDIRPIRNEDDYREALRQAESLMSSGAGTPEGDMLDVLATLIAAKTSVLSFIFWETCGKHTPGRRAHQYKQKTGACKTC